MPIASPAQVGMKPFMAERGATRHRLRPMIRKLLVLLLSVSLAACETSYVDEPGISPEQRSLRAAAGQFSNPDYAPRTRSVETIAMGAGLGALLGAGIGALAGGGRGAAIGAGAGLAAGGIGGAVVAQNAQRAANQEAGIRVAIDRANKDAQQFRGYTQVARQVAANARAQIAHLDAQRRAGAITNETFRQQLGTYQRDLQAMQQLANAGGRVSGAIGAQAQYDQRFAPSGADVRNSTASLNQAIANLQQALTEVGAAPAMPAAPPGAVPVVK